MLIVSKGIAFSVLELPVFASQLGKDLKLGLWAVSLRGSMYFRKKTYQSPKGTENLNAGRWFALHFNNPETW